MAVPTVMRWDHKNAPLIDNRQDWVQIKAWFTAVFVDGYLADDDVTPIPGLGWDVTFDDGTLKYVNLYSGGGIDNTPENKMWVRFSFRRMVDDGYYGAHIQVWEDASGEGQMINSYDINYPKRGLMAPMGVTDASGKYAPWVVVGSSRGVFFLSGYNKSVSTPDKPVKFTDVDTYSHWYYFGDYVNDGVDMGIYNQCCTYEDSTLTAYEMDTVDHMATNNRLRTHGDYSFRGTRSYPTMTDTTTVLENLETYLIHVPLYIGNWYNGIPYPSEDGGFYIKPMELWDATDDVYKGRLPGMFYSLYKRPLAHPEVLLEFDGGGVYEGKQFLGMGQMVYSEFYINITDDWEIE